MNYALNLAVLSALLASFAGCASTASRELVGGDGVVTAPTGEHSFEVQFDSIPLSEPGTYTFRFNTVPATDMHTLLTIENPGPDIAQRLDQAGVIVRMELTGTAGSYRPDSYQVRDGLLEGEWLRTPQSYNAEPLEYVGMWFKPRRNEQFDMKVIVTVADPSKLAGVPIAAAPMIRGGSPVRAAPAHRGSEFVTAPATVE